MKNIILFGDCLIKHEQIKTGSVDLILMDPPYGNMKGITNLGSMEGKFHWDEAIEPAKIFEIANRILRKNGRLIMFCQEPYTSLLITQAIANLPFVYRLIWEKDNFGNPLSAKKCPLNMFEDILVFSKNNPVYDSEFTHPLRPYFKKVFEYIARTKKEIFATVGTGADHVFRFNSSQFSLCTVETYDRLIASFFIDNMPGFKTFAELAEIDLPHKSHLNNTAAKANPSVFNLWEGKSWKSNILKYKKDYDGFHETQKPVLLMEDLIKTFSNEGDTVVDLTAGSGSTAVACENTGRWYTIVEKTLRHYKTIRKRVKKYIFEDDFNEQLDF